MGRRSAFNALNEEMIANQADCARLATALARTQDEGVRADLRWSLLEARLRVINICLLILVADRTLE